MSLSIRIRDQATALRIKGYSLKEISDSLHISKSTASVWLSNIDLPIEAQKRLAEKQILGQYKTVLLKRKLREDLLEQYKKLAAREIHQIVPSRALYKLLCALLWWCEGNKDTKVVRFTSSDESLISNYLHSLRSGFTIDESKFRALVHLHSYHDDITQREYWSNVTKIPIKQFYKSFHKKNTGKRIHNEYQGCVAVSYYDAKIAKELQALYNAFTLAPGGVR